MVFLYMHRFMSSSHKKWGHLRTILGIILYGLGTIEPSKKKQPKQSLKISCSSPFIVTDLVRTLDTYIYVTVYFDPLIVFK